LNCQKLKNFSLFLKSRPLHFAAKAGNFEIVKLLLAKRAPAMPRTLDGLFPRDLAKREIAEYLDDFKPTITTYSNKWDHGTLERKEAFQLLLEKREELYEKLKNADGECENPYVNTSKEMDELISGLFLVRKSERNNGNNVITMLHNNELKNYKIEQIVSQ
jgi:ankyrin repeat protein